MLSIDRASQRERAAVAAFQQLPRTLQRQVTDQTRLEVVPLALAAARRHARNGVMRVITARARYSPFKGTPAVAWGGTGAVTSSGATGRELVRGLEYGARGRWRQQYQSTSKGGRSFTVRRRTTRQFLPDRSSAPATVTPAMESITDDVLELWTSKVEQAAVDAFDAGS